MAPQFPNFRRVRRRIRRTLCYGSKQPQSINLPLSELVVDYFNKQSPFDYMKPETSASIGSRGYADPCTLVVAMVYLDRLRVNDKAWFESSDPTDLYLPALVLASKFLHDSDTYDRATNADWAEAANISNQHLNQLEWEFVQRMNWNVMVGQAEFDKWLTFFEHWVANDFVTKNGFCTYNEILQLSSSFPLMAMLQSVVSFFGLMTAVYTFSVMSLFAVPCALSSLKAPAPENHTVIPVPCIAPIPVDVEDTRIPSISRDDFIEDFAADSHENTLKMWNFSVEEPPCHEDNETSDYIAHEVERFPDRCLGYISSFSDYSRPFIRMVS